MRQNSKVEPSTTSSPAIALHPVLSLTLANLDIQLEDELVRYRRQRASAGCAVPQSKRKQPPQQLDLIAVAATSDRNSTNAAQPTPALEERLIGVAEQVIAPDTYKPIPAFTASPQPFEAAIALRTPPKPLTQDGSADQSSLDAEGNDVHALAHAANPNLDDYLESSEELLRSLADERAEVQAERNFMQSLLTPLGLGAMLLLLLSSAMFGYVIMNPSSLGWLTAKQNNNAASTPPVPNGGQTAIAPPQPDLAKRELPDLNLNNLGTVNVSPGSLSSSSLSTKTTAIPNGKLTVAAKSAAASPQPSREASAPVEQAPIPAVTSSSSRSSPVRTYEPPQAATSSQTAVASKRSSPKTYSAPVPPTAIRATAPTAARSASGDAYPFKVITQYDGDSALTKSQAVVPDAYLRNFPTGAKIQLGASGDRASAEAKAQELRARGIPAEVYKP